MTNELDEVLNNLDAVHNSEVKKAEDRFRQANIERLDFISSTLAPQSKLGRKVYDKKLEAFDQKCAAAWEEYEQVVGYMKNPAEIEGHIAYQDKALGEKMASDDHYADALKASGKFFSEKLANHNKYVIGQEDSNGFDMHEALMNFRRNRGGYFDEEKMSIDLTKALQEEGSVKKTMQAPLHYSQEKGSNIWAAETLADVEGEFKRLEKIQKSLLQQNGRWPTHDQVIEEEARLEQAKTRKHEITHVQSNVQNQKR